MWYIGTYVAMKESVIQKCELSHESKWCEKILASSKNHIEYTDAMVFVIEKMTVDMVVLMRKL